LVLKTFQREIYIPENIKITYLTSKILREVSILTMLYQLHFGCKSKLKRVVNTTRKKDAKRHFSKCVFRWQNFKFWEILNFKNFKYFNWNSFIYKILYLNKKIKIMRVKKKMNEKNRRYDWYASYTCFSMLIFDRCSMSSDGISWGKL